MKFIGIHLLVTVSLWASNALVKEASPYLRQHSENPVEWIAWSDDLLKRSHQEHKPIFISIGYSTCHWCHVMAHESFENEEIAKIINTYFIPVKVDREEMPYLDSRYQQLHRLIVHRNGGWPLNAILTEHGEVFWIGTYVPPHDQYGVEGMDSLMRRIGQGYQKNSLPYVKQAKAIQIMEKKPIAKDASNPISPTLIFSAISSKYDPLYHGFSIAPKFPEASKIALLLDLGQSGNAKAQSMGLDVLRSMALGGLYDQVEGGFFRYSTDAAWEIPHFEKMLYTQAELIPLYVRAYRITKDPLYANIVHETITMTQQRFGDNGVYMSASDADSKHHEGGYFIYTPSEIDSVHPSEEIREAFDLDYGANFEEKFHLHLTVPKRPKEFEPFVASLKKLRESRTYPFTDHKIITSWNAMMIEALYKAGEIDPRYYAEADRSLDALLLSLRPNEKLYHQFIPGYPLNQEGLLEDYAFLISALLSGYDATLDENKLKLAQQLCDEAIAKFHTPEGWVQNTVGQRVNVDLLDKYTTSAFGRMMQNLFILAALSEEPRYGRLAKKSLDVYGSHILDPSLNAPSSMIAWLMEHYGVIALSHNKVILELNASAIKAIGYPYVVRHPETRDDFAACVSGACFANAKELKALEDEIDTFLKSH